MDIDLESGIDMVNVNKEGTLDHDLCEKPISVDDCLVKSSVNADDGSLEDNVKVLMVEGEMVGNFTGKEKRKKSLSAKKPPRPPRPSRGFSLDAYDQRLIKELAEIAMMKRARIERMKKALKEKKALKSSSSSSSSSNGSLFALVFTIMLFLVVLFQGMSCQNSGVTFHVSPQTTQANENGLILIQDQSNSTASASVSPSYKSSK